MTRNALREPAFLVAVGLLSAGAVGLFFAIEAAHIYLTKKPIYPRSGLKLNALPTETAGWIRVGTDHVESAEIVDELGTTNYLTRTYMEKNPSDQRAPRTVQLHIAYYTGMIDTVPHVPDRCFVGAGLRPGGLDERVPITLDDSTWLERRDVRDDWKGLVFTMRPSSEYGITGGARVTLPRNPDKITMRAMNFIDDRTGQTLYAGYFFIANGGTVARAEGVRLLAFDLSDDYAYYMKVQFTSQSVTSGEDFGELASSLFNDLIGDIMFCIPDWVEVDLGLWPTNKPQHAASAGEDDPGPNR
ncbi:MAG: exosortase-associated EpsI family protein [Planctomycetes bacterium]|nr:exosortase-associated EpsI family protein [Planctomycetota bacterium]